MLESRKCRICLRSEGYLVSIFECNNQSLLSYSDMIFFVANIKIEKSDSHEELICTRCKKKLKESYEFKILIVRSNDELNQTLNVKRIPFDNFREVKSLVLNLKQEPSTIKFNWDEIGDSKTFYYNDTLISRVPVECPEVLEYYPDDDNVENDNDFQFDNELDYKSESDEEYTLPLTSRRTSKRWHRNIIKEDQQPKKRKDSELLDYKSSSDEKYTVPIYTRSTRRRQYENNLIEEPKPKPKPKEKVYKALAIKASVGIRPEVLDHSVNVKYPARPKKEKHVRLCPYCGKKDYPGHLLIHTSERKYKCESGCNKRFYTLKEAENHMKQHLNPKTLKCDICAATFSHACLLRSHKVVHEEESRNHVCEICSKAFKRKKALIRHKRQHAMPKFECTECGRRFNTSTNLRHHERVHTRERPFNCEICSQPYSYRFDFSKHCWNKHGIYLKHRWFVKVMNEEVIVREQNTMREIYSQMKSGLTIHEIKNPFEGPFAQIALVSAMKMLQEQKIPIAGLYDT